VLLRRGPVSGKVMALTRYTYKRNGSILQAATDGKHDVTADFNDLVLTTLFDAAGGLDDDGVEDIDSPDIIKALDYAVSLMLEKQGNDPEALDLAAQTDAFRKRLVKIAVEHNNRNGHAQA
jgi:hypothetical protein